MFETPPDAAAIQAAAARIAPHIRRTPVLRLNGAELGLPGRLVLKLETLQASGSFKARGAFNRLLSQPVPAAGVVAASGGNHGAAVAYAARALGHRAEIFCPAATPAAKADRITAYGARLHRIGAAYDEARVASEAHAAESGALQVHAYDQAEVLAGQGTLGMELWQDAPQATHVLVATGGGGLIGGIAAWYAGRNTEVISVEPEACPTLHQALAAGRPVPAPVGGLAADSLGARQVGGLMFQLAQRHVAQAVLVPDAAIAAAQKLLWSALRVVAEPGGATALAALACGAFVPPPGAVVAVVICGGNTDPAAVAG
ncbi:serine/threonine dehydratase [Falsiroseomonas selenitidurans]|uniref:Serine/threonine dehydratase n=1 Tax=Falsiroseomonas selenitidurans TaxID=2716335 RepID=A0ABX1EAW2_9PROT|nr:serine/threonine dehydratase [Falsiroseomonas selenitidurans]NKC32617.1 serine/threonine dehydratase [Falsiroseomonas selenitidurans]